jgi:D-threonate/D-erythronate kinase
MTTLRLVADDLTGALDSAAQFACADRPVPVYLEPPVSPPRAFGVDAATREADPATAEAIARRLAPLLAPEPGVTAFKKVDSLLRGHPGRELAALLTALGQRHCVIAPAFPFHGRVTRGGRQYFQKEGAWRITGADVKASLEARGLPVLLARPGDRFEGGITLWDAETDADLRAVAEAASGFGEPVLWCGSGGLAAALAGPAAPAIPLARFRRPMLGLFGSDHPSTAAQLSACGGHVLGVADCGPATTALIAARLSDTGTALVRFDLGSGMTRGQASARIAHEVHSLATDMKGPQTLLIAGGETLRSLCLSLGTEHLAVLGQIDPGVPVSRMVGGRWDGTEVISKSGGFGDDRLLMRIISSGRAT